MVFNEVISGLNPLNYFKMKKVVSILAVALFSISMYNCTEESIADENEVYATGKDCSSSGGDKTGCEED